jgi:ketosteroid isomerase-like protein
MNPTQTNAEAIKAFTHAMTHKDINGFMRLWASDGAWEIMATSETFRGPEQIRQPVSRIVGTGEHLPGTGLFPFDVYSNTKGTRLCWEYVHKGVVTDNWPVSTHKAAPGVVYELPIVLICKIHEGKFVRVREYFDLLTLLEPETPRKLYS